MGLLDDAIRDHLDLKRRHGADPAELERAEREALGPVRRKGDVAATGFADEADEPFALGDDEAPVSTRPVAYDQAEDDWSHGGEDDLAVPGPEPIAEPPRRSRRSMTDVDLDAELDSGADVAEPDQDQPRGLAARFGLRGRRSEEEPEPELDEPLAEDEPTRVHRAEGSGAGSTPTGGETAEHDLDEAPPRDSTDDDEDMLEETPEFLQDAPDHDRLWFEQRPPRDFDFDG